MQLTVLTWLRDNSIGFIGRVIEITFRLILCLLPLGVYMVLLQKRSKASTINNISVYTKDYSRWQHVFPGFILVSVEPEALTNYFTRVNSNFQGWINRNKYLLSFLFMLTVVGLMILSYIRGGNL